MWTSLLTRHERYNWLISFLWRSVYIHHCYFECVFCLFICWHLKSFVAKRNISTYVNLRFLRLKLRKHKKYEKQIVRIFIINSEICFNNYVMNEASFERHHFVLDDGGLTSTSGVYFLLQLNSSSCIKIHKTYKDIHTHRYKQAHDIHTYKQTHAIHTYKQAHAIHTYKHRHAIHTCTNTDMLYTHTNNHIRHTHTSTHAIHTY